MSDECWGFCCLCCACFGLFGQGGCMDCCRKPSMKDDPDASAKARAQEYDLFTQAQPRPHPSPQPVITEADPDVVSGNVEKLGSQGRDSQEKGEYVANGQANTDRITAHEDKLRGEKRTEADIPEAPVQTASHSVLAVTEADPETVVSSDSRDRPSEGRERGDPNVKIVEEEFPAERVAAHKEQAQEYYYWGGGGSS